MLPMFMVAVWVMVLAINPGLALVTSAFGLAVLDRFEPAFITRLLGREAG